MSRARILAAALLLAAGGSCSKGADQSSTTTSRPARAVAGGTCWNAAVTPAHGALEWQDATAKMGLDEPLRGMYGHGAAMADVDGDGWLDLFVGTFSDKGDDKYKLRGATGPAPDRLLKGGPDGFRVDATFPAEYGRTTGAVFADLDGDGDLDLVISRNARSDESARRPLVDTVVLANDGGHFKEVSRPADGVGGRAIAVVDADSDGRPDLFLAEDRFLGGSSVLLHNDGGLKFSDATARSGLPSDIEGLGAVAADLDLDGHPDLLVAGRSTRLFLGKNGGGFEEAKVPVLGTQKYGDEDDAAGIAVGDLDRDGRPDLVVGQHYNSTLDDNRKVPVRVYLNRTKPGDGPSFDDVTESAGVPNFSTKAPHVEIVDLDNDGWPDVLTSASAEGGTRPAVLHNRGSEHLAFDVPAGLGDKEYWVTGVTGDVNRDGRIDVFLVDPDPAKPSLLLLNSSPVGHWLSVQLPPASAVGSVVEVFRAGGIGDDAKLLLRRQFVNGDGYAAGPAPIVHVGLGELTTADVRVTPLGKATPPVTMAGVQADRVIMPGGCDPSR